MKWVCNPTRGIGGVPLIGDRIARFVYLDEAGTSNRKHEPFTVVAGVIIDMDRQWREVQEYYLDLASHHFPERLENRFVFHASHIWQGNKDFSRRNWPLDERLRLLKQLAQAPQLLDLPIVAAAVDREETRRELLKSNPSMTENAVEFHTYSAAFIQAVKCADLWMRNNAPNEVAMLIAEEKHGVQGAMQMYHTGYTHPFGDAAEAFTSQHIVDSLMYARKDEALLLQIADHCAFIIKRRCMGRPDAKDLYKLIEPKLHWETDQPQTLRLSVRSNMVEIIPDPDPSAAGA